MIKFKKILVTGGTGFLGKHVIKILLNYFKSDEVVIHGSDECNLLSYQDTFLKSKDFQCAILVYRSFVI